MKKEFPRVTMECTAAGDRFELHLTSIYIAPGYSVFVDTNGQDQVMSED
jgi:hypothetical protein